MKKKQIIYNIINFLIIAILVGGVVYLRSKDFGLEKASLIYETLDGEREIVEVMIPRFSYGFKENEKNSSFKNIRSYKILEKEMNDVLKDYEKITCEGNEYYYHQEKNYTLKVYKLERKIPHNLITVEYVLGKVC